MVAILCLGEDMRSELQRTLPHDVPSMRCAFSRLCCLPYKSPYLDLAAHLRSRNHSPLPPAVTPLHSSDKS
jgi:hypothetical protein